MSDKEDSLFGSGSDAEEQPQQQDNQEEQQQTPERREEYDGLFGDEEDEDEEQDVPGTAARRNRKSAPKERRSTYIVPPPDPSTIRTVKLSNMINIKTQPFDPTTHEAGTDLVQDEFGNQRLNLHHLNTVRWRWTKDPVTGQRVPQSNARFVRWEDGSTTLHIGDEVLSVAEVQDHAARRYLYVRVNGLMQLHPASLNGKLHKAIQLMMAQTSAKQVKVRTSEAMNKSTAKEEEERMAEIQKSREQLKRKQKQQRHKYSRPSSGRRGAAPIPEFNEQYLDQSDDDDEDFTQAAAGRDRRGLDLGQEAAAERRLTAAKTGEAWRVTKRRLDDDEDEELSDMDDEPLPRAAKIIKRGGALLDSGDESS